MAMYFSMLICNQVHFYVNAETFRQNIHAMSTNNNCSPKFVLLGMKVEMFFGPRDLMECGRPEMRNKES